MTPPENLVDAQVVGTLLILRDQGLDINMYTKSGAEAYKKHGMPHHQPEGEKPIKWEAKEPKVCMHPSHNFPGMLYIPPR